MSSDVTVPRNVGPVCRALIDLVVVEAARRGTPVSVSAQYDLTAELVYVYTLTTPMPTVVDLPRYVSVSIPIAVFAGGSIVPAATRDLVLAGLLG